VELEQGRKKTMERGKGKGSRIMAYLNYPSHPERKQTLPEG